MIGKVHDSMHCKYEEKKKNNSHRTIEYYVLLYFNAKGDNLQFSGNKTLIFYFFFP